MKPLLIGVAGPSGAGKSTVCRRLIEVYPFVGRLKFDDFFCDQSDVERHPLGYDNWDSPASIKWEWLAEALDGLRAGVAVQIPHYERAQNRMTGTKRVVPCPVILVDGYQVLFDERIRNQLDAALYFDLPEEVQVDRRMARQPDVDTGYLYHVMIPAARAYLYPTRKYASAVIDASATPDGVFAAVESHLAPLFAKLQATSEYAAHSIQHHQT